MPPAPLAPGPNLRWCDAMYSITPPAPALSPVDPQTGLLTFLIGGDEFCLPVAQVREIRIWSAPTPLPHADPALQGVINLRGLVLPVIDPSVRLGLPPPGSRVRPVIIVIEEKGRQAGVIADRVMDILAIATTSIEPPPAIATSLRMGSLAALALYQGRLLRILDAAHLLASASESPDA